MFHSTHNKVKRKGFWGHHFSRWLKKNLQFTNYLLKKRNLNLNNVRTNNMGQLVLEPGTNSIHEERRTDRQHCTQWNKKVLRTIALFYGARAKNSKQKARIHEKYEYSMKWLSRSRKKINGCTSQRTSFSIKSVLFYLSACRELNPNLHVSVP